MAEDWEVARDELDAAIDKYARLNLEMEGVITGHFIVVESARMQDDGDTVYRVRYSSRVGMTLSSCRGLAEMGREMLSSDTDSS